MIGGGEIFLILLIVLIFFGSDKIPGFAKNLGKAMREFKKATQEIKDEITKETDGTFDEIKQIGNDIKRDINPNITTHELTNPFQDLKDQVKKDLKE